MANIKSINTKIKRGKREERKEGRMRRRKRNGIKIRKRR